jgi:phosphatidylglycerol:prolipoprotein diacylglycerol transferase
MYPTITDMLYDLLGVRIPLPIQTYGFFLALAFLVAGVWLYYELRRMERAGIMHGIMEKSVIGNPASLWDLLMNAIMGFLIGFKGTAMLMNWTVFSDNPHEFLLSGRGSLVGGILVAILMCAWRYYETERQRLPQAQVVEDMVYPHQRIGDMIMLAAIFGILGAKIFTWIEDIPAFLRDPVGALLSFSGLTFYGGLICAAATLMYYAYKKQISMGGLIDATAPALILGYGIGRLGCHFSGDGDWGIVNTAPKPFAALPDWAWSYTYPNNVTGQGIPIEGCVGKYCSVLPEGVYPTSVYEFVFSVIIFLVLVAIRRSIRIPGILFGIYLVLNGLERFCIEIVRVNDRYDWAFGMSQAQIIAVSLMLLGVLCMAVFGITGRKPNPTAQD